jgi:hypothetical protein
VVSVKLPAWTFAALPHSHTRPAAVLGDELDALAKIALELAGS